MLGPGTILRVYAHFMESRKLAIIGMPIITSVTRIVGLESREEGEEGRERIDYRY